MTEFRLRKRDDDNVVVAVRLAGKKQDVQIAWAAVVLLTDRDITPNRTPTAPYLKESACVQARADAIGKLATQLWPKSEKASAFAANIQGHIRDSKRTAPPKSLDALGILKSGENSICTANANLAAALLRSKGIACRSVAVIPTTGQRLEMHRIVEFAEGERWLPFDPSLIHADIPTKPWQYVVMSRTTVADEQVAMKPRLGVMFGCPYGQELELLTPGVGLFGQDFFWTAARPLADFDVPEATARRAAKAWTHFLETGTLTPGQLKARSARTAKALAEALESK